MSSFSARPVSAKPNQVNTPIRRSHAAPDTVTVVDPRHPLYNQTFPVLHIKNQRDLIPSCLVQLPEGVERLIPLVATNLASSPPAIYPLPLDLSSLHNLSQTFGRILAQVKMEQRDEATSRNSPSPNADNPTTGMADADSQPEECCAANGHSHLPQPG